MLWLYYFTYILLQRKLMVSLFYFLQIFLITSYMIFVFIHISYKYFVDIFYLIVITFFFFFFTTAAYKCSKTSDCPTHMCWNYLLPKCINHVCKCIKWMPNFLNIHVLSYSCGTQLFCFSYTFHEPCSYTFVLHPLQYISKITFSRFIV
jgi:hypothetical protein